MPISTCSEALYNLRKREGPGSALRRLQQANLAYGELQVLKAGVLAWILSPRDMKTISAAMLIRAAMVLNNARKSHRKSVKDKLSAERAIIDDKSLKWVWAAYFELGGSFSILRARSIPEWETYLKRRQSEF